MFVLMVLIFVLGYIAIALEHPLRVDKAAPALLIGVLTWVVYIMGSYDILSMVGEAGEFISHAWGELVHSKPEVSKLIQEAPNSAEAAEKLQGEMQTQNPVALKRETNLLVELQ